MYVTIIIFSQYTYKIFGGSYRRGFMDVARQFHGRLPDMFQWTVFGSMI